MRIKQVEDLLGIDRETIRFYIREGLLSPKQSSNRYREYTDEDVRQLKRILIMRDLEMSVADIRGVLAGETDFVSELKNSSDLLSEKQAAVTDSIRICNELMQSGGTAFDPERYFRRRERTA